MRRLLFIPIPVVALLVGFGMSAVGQGHAQSPARLAAQGSTITQSFTFTGPGLGVSTTGQFSYVGINRVKLDDGSTASDSYAGTNYSPAANGCEAATLPHWTRTFAIPADTFDAAGIGVGCPVPGNAAQSKNSANFIITGGTGRYKGAIGTGTFTNTCTVVPPKAGQPIAFNCTGQGTDTLTLAGQ